jgi:predicted lipoprotein with Yx(FWY)xxD motif
MDRGRHAVLLSSRQVFTHLNEKESKMKISHILLSAAVSLALSNAAFAQSAAVKKADGVLVTSEGMTVYTFDKDTTEGKSACYGPCATNWPAVTAGETKLAPPYGAITRDDGSKQLTYKGKPLYTFVKDKKAGDRNGDNLKDMWHVVKD